MGVGWHFASRYVLRFTWSLYIHMPQKIDPHHEPSIGSTSHQMNNWLIIIRWIIQAAQLSPFEETKIEGYLRLQTTESRFFLAWEQIFDERTKEREACKGQWREKDLAFKVGWLKARKQIKPEDFFDDLVASFSFSGRLYRWSMRGKYIIFDYF